MLQLTWYLKEIVIQTITHSHRIFTTILQLNNLDIRFACKDETDIELLKALAMRKMLIKTTKLMLYSDYDQSSPLATCLVSSSECISH
jgi:hypothetical protein